MKVAIKKGNGRRHEHELLAKLKFKFKAHTAK
jgi:hypothetical protein